MKEAITGRSRVLDPGFGRHPSALIDQVLAIVKADTDSTLVHLAPFLAACLVHVQSFPSRNPSLLSAGRDRLLTDHACATWTISVQMQLVVGRPNSWEQEVSSDEEQQLCATANLTSMTTTGDGTMSDRRPLNGGYPCNSRGTAGGGSDGALSSERVVRLKEERRKEQLPIKLNSSQPSTTKRFLTRPRSTTDETRSKTPVEATSTSTSVRTTRASRLRAGLSDTTSRATPALSTTSSKFSSSTVRSQSARELSSQQRPSSKEINGGNSANTGKSRRFGPLDTNYPQASSRKPASNFYSEKITITNSTPSSPSSSSLDSKREKDKSGKRKSNLNRSLAAEAAPPDPHLTGDQQSRRRRRRPDGPLGTSEGAGISATAVSRVLSETSLSVSRGVVSTPRQLAEEVSHAGGNSSSSSCGDRASSARKTSSVQAVKRTGLNGTGNVSPRPRTTFSNGTTLNKPVPAARAFPKPTTRPISSPRISNPEPTSISSGEPDSRNTPSPTRVDLLAEKTREKLSQMSRKNTPPNGIDELPSSLPLNESNRSPTPPVVPRPTASILKKKSSEENPCITPPPPCITQPVSILKRKTSHEDSAQATTVHPPPPPVTFSPTVTDHIREGARKQGILKKRRSLDESEVLRRRSCSPDLSDYRPILKPQRRSSLEELVRRAYSPEPQSILKRKSSRDEEGEEHRSSGSPEPQGILKRKSTSSQSSLDNNPPHVSLMPYLSSGTVSLDSGEYSDTEVKPILKKKSSFEETIAAESYNSDGPRPILKKKTSCDSDFELDDRPMKPILKTFRKSSNEDNLGINLETSPSRFLSIRNSDGSLNESELRPSILKQPERSHSPRSRFSFDNSSSPSQSLDGVVRRRPIGLARSHSDAIDSELIAALSKRRSIELGEVPLVSNDLSESRRPVSPVRRGAVSERVTFLEQDTSSSGAVPRRIRTNRSSERFRTQPITLDELNDSERVVQQSLVHQSPESSHFSSPSRSPRFSIGEKMNSKDEANPSPNISARNPLFIQELKRNSTDSANRRTHSRQDKARFATHPVTLSEVEEAVKTGRRHLHSEQEDPPQVVESSTTTTTNTDDGDPSKLSLAERVRLFNLKSQPTQPSTPTPAVVSHRKARFRTQPVTNEEMAQVVSPLAATLVKPPDPDSLGNLSIHAAREKIYENAYSMLSRAASFGGRSEPPSLSPRINGEKINPKGILKKENESKKSQEIDSDSEEEVRGILKSPPPSSYSATGSHSPELEGFKHLKSVLKKESESSQKAQPANSENEKQKSILKSSRSSTFDNDDTSSGESISNDELENHIPTSNNLAEMLLQETNKSNQLNNNHPNNLNAIAVAQRNARNVSYRRSIGESLEAELRARLEQRTTPPTSDGETSSSGGREIQRIIGNEAVARRRQAAISKQAHQLNRCSLVSKSQSQSSVRHQLRSAAANAEAETIEDARSFALRRCLTQPLAPENDTMSGVSIAERRAALQENGQTGWRKRIPKLKPEDERSTTNFIQELAARRSEEVDNTNSTPAADPPAPIGSILAERLNKLETASNDWKKRVHQSDAEKFSVAGKMKMDEAAGGDIRKPLERTPSLNKSPLLEIIGNDKQKKRTPKPVRFRSKAAHFPDVSASTPSSPSSKGSSPFKRSLSAPGDADSDESPIVSPVVESPIEEELPGRLVAVPRADDETFTSFYSQETTILHSETTVEVNLDAIEAHTPLSTGILRERARFQAGRRAPKMRNPIRALANRLDLHTEYIETTTGFAEKELKRYKMEQLVKHNKPHIAMEALAGLASKEDFKAVNLRKTGVQQTSDLSPFKDLMLLHIKGRRHVQTRLVEPIASSINHGDCYVLVTPKQVFLWIGKYANVIERSRGAEVSQHIVQHRDLGCKSNQVITLSADKPCSPGHLNTFWKLLNHDTTADKKENAAAIPAGLADEDELYETLLVETNKIYELNEEEELVPVESAWGTIPKYELLNPSKILVFDFGSEMYIWQGSQVSTEMRRIAIRLARELWSEGFDYSECSISPLSVALLLGQRPPDQLVESSSSERPTWAILAKMNQHMETILFREKFLDWPDFSRVIRVKEEEKQTESSIEMKPCDPKSMYENEVGEPDLELEGTHLGRGNHYYDEETHRHYEITSKGIQVWHISEYDYTELPETSIGQFHEQDSYIIRWQYNVSITGRELSGLPSKHNMIGRERCAYFCWQGSASPQCEKGAAALLTIELDRERGPQIRVVQNTEPPAFLRLFDGKMIVHFGRRGLSNKKVPWRLYICRGEMPSEAILVQVPCNVRSLRSRACFILINTKTGQIFCWNGSKAPSHARKVIRSAIDYLRKKPQEIGFTETCSVKVSDQEEGSESSAFFEGVGGANRHLYISLKNREESFTVTPRLYHLSSLSGTFSFAELAGPYRATLDDHCTPFPFTQNDLYSASQPALFLLDVGHELWLWQGWWPDHPDEETGTTEDNSQLTGSGAIRWQAERKEAMRTALDYWALRHPETASQPKAFLVWAGLEPLSFTNLFPIWTDRDDIAELSIRDGKKPGEVLSVENELSRLTRTTYPLDQLMTHPLPEGVDPTRLEEYLTPEEFEKILGLTKEEFIKLALWKQTSLKKNAGLF